MQLADLSPFFGRTCTVTVRCQACGREHDFWGILAPGPHRGDVDVSDVVYSSDDVVAVSTDADFPVPALSLSRLLPYAGIAGLIAAWAHAVRR